MGANAPSMIYNKDLLTKAGVAFPTEKSTWKDLENACNQVNKKLGIPGLWSMGVGYNDFEIFTREKK